MEQNELLALTESFLSYDFSLREALLQLGTVRYQHEERISLTPRSNANLAEVTLEHNDGFLYEIQLAFERGAALDLDLLVVSLGQYEVLPRPSPFSALSYRFRLEGDSQEVSLVLSFYATIDPPTVKSAMLYRTPRPQLEGPLLTEGQLFQLIELFLRPRLSRMQTAAIFGAEMLTGGALQPAPDKNLRAIEIEQDGPRGEIEGIWLHLQTPVKLSKEILAARLGTPELGLATTNPLGPVTYDFPTIRRRGLFGSLSLQSPSGGPETAQFTESLLLRRTSEERLGFPFWNTQHSIVPLIESFLGVGATEDFSPELLLGRLAQETPFGVELAPEAGSNVRRAYLEKSHNQQGAPTISGVSLQLREPIELDWPWLEQSFGSAVEAPLWKLSGHKLYRFSCQGSKSQGHLWLGVRADLPGRWVESIALRRTVAVPW